ncbi:translation initiation factor IF-3 [Cerasicoccus fimbriatus]|uniref:translation initiation factor IF-3 n=1 Tax=Cerasicoccus fimbriatus TaxID=3014554 RepID=UPI0022B394A4|nr:translation initiation factor IF-3 [Cerasicoccus sp. TK19100]
MGKAPFGRGRGRNFNRGPRKNERIRVPEIRVIGPDGKQVGVMKTKDALDLAKQAGLDLLEVSPNARPPVCRILDYGKFQYEQSKREKDSKKHQAATRMKEVKFRVRIEEHDFMTKLRRAEEFLDHGSKLKITLMFRGREMQHQDLGFVVVKRAIEDLSHIGHLDSPPKLVGRNITTTMSPLPANKKQPLKYSHHHGEDPDEHDDEEHEHDEEHDEQEKE